MYEQQEKSEFNFAISFLNRLNNWFYVAGQNAYDLNGVGWFHSLMNIYREIADDMKPDQRKECEDKQRDINQSIMRLSKMKGNGHSIDYPTYIKLHNFEIYLRTVIKAVGYKTKFADDPNFALR